MHKCDICGVNDTYTYMCKYKAHVCEECREKLKQEEVLEKSKTVSKPSDFKEWDSGDMSELFWIHLGKYIKEPNAHSLTMMEIAFRWACHDNHGISNSFRHALKWAGIDLYSEELRWRKSGGQ